MERTEILHNMRFLPCLSEIGDEGLSAIAELAQIKTFLKNERLFDETKAVKDMFIMISGLIKLHKTSSEGRELIIKMMGPGDYFCCAPLFLIDKHFVTATVVEESTLLTIPSGRFREIVFGNMDRTGMKIITGLCNRIKYLSGLVEELTFKDVEQRVLTMLLKQLEKERPDADIVPLTLTHYDIASMTGTVREVVSRVMSKLKKEGIIVESTVRGFKVDRERLHEISERKLFHDIGIPEKKEDL